MRWGGMVRGGVPGWRVESSAFFACHSSGLIEGICPCLYFVMSVLACSRLALDMNSVLPTPSATDFRAQKAGSYVGDGSYRVYTDPSGFSSWDVGWPWSHLGSAMSAECFTRPQYVLRSWREAGRSLLPGRELDMAGGRPRAHLQGLRMKCSLKELQL